MASSLIGNEVSPKGIAGSTPVPSASKIPNNKIPPAGSIHS